MDADAYVRKLRFRATHRGTREADAMVGGFFEYNHSEWSQSEFAWFEQILEQQDVDIMSWAFGRTNPPSELEGPLMDIMRQLDFIELPAGLKDNS